MSDDPGCLGPLYLQHTPPRQRLEAKLEACERCGGELVAFSDDRVARGARVECHACGYWYDQLPPRCGVAHA